MEILVILFLLGLLLAIGKWIWEFFFVAHRGCTAALIAVAIAIAAVVVAIPVLKERRLEAERKAEVAREMEQKRQRAEDARRAQENERKARLQKERELEDKIRSFAMKESPGLWEAYQELNGSLDEQIKRVDNLRRELRDFKRDPETHPEYQRVSKLLEDMRRTRDTIRENLEEAYLASRAFDAMPEKGREKAQVCIQEAETALDKYKRLVFDNKTETMTKEKTRE